MTTWTHISTRDEYARKFGDDLFFNGDGFYDKDTGKKDERPPRGIGVPMIISDNWQAYRSVVTGDVVQGKTARREELAAAADRGLVPFERIDGKPPGLINKEFAAKSGRRTSEATEEWAANKRKSQAVKTDASGAILSE